MGWWTREDIEDRLSATVVKECLDDDNTGEPKPGVLERLHRDSVSYVGGALADVYPDFPFEGVGVPNECTRLALNWVRMELALRHPEVIQHSWKDLDAVLDREVKDIRTAKRSLAKKPPDPAANHGGAVYPTPDPLGGTNVPIFSGAQGRWGIF